MLPKKASKPITVDEVNYRWMITQNLVMVVSSKDYGTEKFDYKPFVKKEYSVVYRDPSFAASFIKILRSNEDPSELDINNQLMTWD